MNLDSDRRIAGLETELAEAHRLLSFTREWAVSRMLKLKELVHKLPADIQTEFAAILSELPPGRESAIVSALPTSAP
jgi:hypothetical protein